MVINIERPVHQRFGRYAENIAIVSESVAEDPNVSISCCSQEFGYLHPFKVQLTQQLKPADHSQRCDTWNECLNNKRSSAIFRTKFSSAMKHTRWVC